MQTYIFGILTAFFAVHAYRDYLHSKGVIHEKFITRVLHIWDAPRYEKHGMIGSVILASVFFWFTIT